MAEGTDAHIRITSKPNRWLVTKVRVSNYGTPDDILLLVDRGVQDLMNRDIYYSQESGTEYASALANAMVENSNGHAVTYRGDDPEWSSYAIHINLPKGVTIIFDKERNQSHSVEHLPEGYSEVANVTKGPWLGSTTKPNQPPSQMNTPLQSVESEIIDIKRRAGLLEDS
jgi:hypothetical protein